MEEHLLTKDEIAEILLQEWKNPGLKNPFVISFGNKRNDIQKISPAKFLIFIVGDEHTGWKHIHMRHDYYSGETYWNDGKLDNPSKFNRKHIPFTDYIRIAEGLYDDKFLSVDKNKKPDIFDVYIGIVIENNEPVTYQMILYKGTKIVHTLFPIQKEKEKKKKIINYSRGSVEATFETEDCMVTYEVPYLNHNQEKIYSYKIVRDYQNGKHTEVIYNHKLHKYATINEGSFDPKDFDFNNQMKDTCRYLDFSDLSQIEKIIKDLEKTVPKEDIEFVLLNESHRVLMHLFINEMRDINSRAIFTIQDLKVVSKIAETSQIDEILKFLLEYGLVQLSFDKYELKTEKFEMTQKAKLPFKSFLQSKKYRVHETEEVAFHEKTKSQSTFNLSESDNIELDKIRLTWKQLIENFYNQFVCDEKRLEIVLELFKEVHSEIQKNHKLDSEKANAILRYCFYTYDSNPFNEYEDSKRAVMEYMQVSLN